MNKYPANIGLTKQVEEITLYIQEIEAQSKCLGKGVTMNFIEKLFGKWEEIGSKYIVTNEGRPYMLILEQHTKSGKQRAYAEFCTRVKKTNVYTPS